MMDNMTIDKQDTKAAEGQTLIPDLVPPCDGSIWVSRRGAVVMSMKTFEELRGRK